MFGRSRHGNQGAAGPHRQQSKSSVADDLRTATSLGAHIVNMPTILTGFSNVSCGKPEHQQNLGSLARLLILGLVIGTTAAGCAGRNNSLGDNGSIDDGDPLAAAEIADPLENVNRAVFAFNDQVDTAIIKPTAKVYRAALPEPVRDSVRSFLRNLRTPVILANDLMQGELGRAEETTARFLINSTIGVGGLFDVADNLSGIPYHDEDFGQTLAVWGLGDGFYLVLPLLGPSSARDGTGKLVDSFLDPLNYISGGTTQTFISVGRTGIEGIDTRSENIEALDQIRADSIDFYARVRSMYHQHRQYLIANGDDPNNISTPAIFILDTEDDGGGDFGSDFDGALGNDFGSADDGADSNGGQENERNTIEVDILND